MNGWGMSILFAVCAKLHAKWVHPGNKNIVIPNSESFGFQSLGRAGSGTPRKTGTVLEPCWNLGTLPDNIATLEPWSLLLRCKAGLILEH